MTEGLVLLAGLVWQATTADPRSIVSTVTDSIARGHYTDLATISENAAGCFIKQDGTIYLWVGFSSKDSIFFRTDGPRLRWSTNPLDLIHDASEMDLWALRRCCHGDDVFIYSSLHRVEQGQLVTIHPARTISTQQIDCFRPDSFLTSRTTTLETFREPTRKALQLAVQPLLSERVGMLLSGGSGSAAILATLKAAGVDTIAYHMESPDPAGSEYHFARLVCEALDIPLHRISMDTEASYLSSQWIFSHPYGHPWARFYEQVAQQAQKDRISLLVTGGGDDSAFGPGLQYGLHAILSARLAWKEKRAMLRRILATDWNVFAILRSLLPIHSLIGPSSLSGVKKEDHEMRRADFLTPISKPRAWDDIALQHAPCFAPQAIALEQAILQPAGIRLYNPYHQRAVQAISLALPDAYKLTPNIFPQFTRTARIIDKPVLRLAFDDVPAEVMWRTWNVWTQTPGQRFCLHQTARLQDLLGGHSHLATLGIADPSRLECVLESRVLIRKNYQTLVTSAMVELFLRNAWQPQLKRGGPVWANTIN
ncbi:hypothetical protein KDI_47460 [Dictyobacter arantiisoli]|uniref:Asparagine synthetase domain-containing protein n=2 Tax=Dictyobacter arantiisoli TaxID=2014874 RepID=A0A5A5TIM8_9CHLR|nr:hypothetical protein KDI_47460 [Dictyobacter arantiisoli]